MKELTVRKLWDLGANPIEVAESIVKFVADCLYLKHELTVYRASGTVNQLKEISNNIEESQLANIAEHFSTLVRSNNDDLLSLELTVCSIFTDYPNSSKTIVPDVKAW